VKADELAELCAEVARLRASTDALAKVIGLFYRAGYDDALNPGLVRARDASRPRRDRGVLALVPGDGAK
jgi:hypothetical protein